MKDALLTNSGNVLIDNYFVTPQGKFLRIVGSEELEYLQVTLTPIKIDVKTKPLHWKHLWTTRIEDYSQYEAGKSNNGGSYAFYTEKHYFARGEGSMLEFCVLETRSTSAEFNYTDCGQFQNRSETQIFSLIGIEDEKEWTYVTIGRGEDFEELPLDKVAEKCTLQEVLTAKSIEIDEEGDEDNSLNASDLSREEREKKIETLFGRSFVPTKRSRPVRSRNQRRY